MKEFLCRCANSGVQRKVASPVRKRKPKALEPLGCGCQVRFTVRRADPLSEECSIAFQESEHNDACRGRSAFGFLYLSVEAVRHLREVVQKNQHRPTIEIMDMYQRPFAEQCLQLKGIPPSEAAIAKLRKQWLADPATMPRDARIEEKDVRNMQARNCPTTAHSLSCVLLDSYLLLSVFLSFVWGGRHISRSGGIRSPCSRRPGDSMQTMLPVSTCG